MAILKELLEIIEEGAGMDAQRRAVRQIAGITKPTMHRAEMKKRARKLFRQHGTEFVDNVAGILRRDRKDVKNIKSEEEEQEGWPEDNHHGQECPLCTTWVWEDPDGELDCPDCGAHLEYKPNHTG